MSSGMPVWYVIVWTVILRTLAVSAKSIPEYLHVCRKSDPEVGQCISNSVESLRDRLIAGLPELGVPSIEPLLIDEPISTQGAGITVTTKDLKAFGGGNFTIKKMEADLTKYTYKFVLGFPHLSIEGNYMVDGKIIMIPLKGNGELKCDVYDVTADVEMDAKVEEIDGLKQLRFLSMTIDVNVGNGKINLGNLFGGDKVIGDVINAAINLNFQYFIKELKPIIQNTLNHFIIKSANNICEGLNYDDLVPE